MGSVEIYDECGVINFNQIKIPLKKTDGVVVFVKHRENTNVEKKYPLLKACVKSFNIDDFK